MFFVKRTLSSQIPFNSGNYIGANIPPSQTKVFELYLDDHEQEPYQCYQTKNRKSLFVKDSRTEISSDGNGSFHRKLRCLVLASSWLGFLYVWHIANDGFVSGLDH